MLHLTLNILSLHLPSPTLSGWWVIVLNKGITCLLFSFQPHKLYNNNKRSNESPSDSQKLLMHQACPKNNLLQLSIYWPLEEPAYLVKTHPVIQKGWDVQLLKQATFWLHCIVFDPLTKETMTFCFSLLLYLYFYHFLTKLECWVFLIGSHVKGGTLSDTSGRQWNLCMGSIVERP